MRKIVLFAPLLVLAPLPLVAGQCPNRAAVYAQLLTTEKLPNNQSVIKAATRLASQCIRCRATDDSVYARIVHLLGRMYLRERDFQKALLYTQQAIAINSRPSVLTSEANLANSYNNLGRVLAEQGLYKKAFTAYDHAVSIARRYPARQYVGAIALGQKAFLYFQQGDYEKANQTAEEGVRLAERANNPSLMAQNLGQQVQALLELKKYKTAETLLNKAIPLIQSLNDLPLFALILSLAAEVDKALNRYEAAITDYQKAFDTYKRADSRYGCAQTLTNLGYFYQQQLKNFPKALQLYKQALTYVDDLNDRARIIDNIGVMQKEQKNYPQALALFQEALRSHSIRFTANKLSTNPNSDAIKSIIQKEYLLSLVLNKADTWLDYAKATQNNPARLRNALRTYALADTMIDFMRWEHTGQQSKLFWRGKTHRLYEQAIETAFRLRDAANAFRFMEKSRAVLLNDKLNELGASRQLAPAQLAQEHQLRQQVADWQIKAAAEKPNTSTYANVLDSLRTAQERQETFVKTLEQTNPVYYRYKYDNQTISLYQLKAELTSRKASLVTYFVGDSLLYALSITPSGNRLLRLPAIAYTKPAAQLLALSANPDVLNRQFTHYLAVANQLYRTLLLPLTLPPGRVIVSPDGVLLPFEALSSSAIKPEFLVKQYAFSYAYSLNQLFRKPANRSHKMDWMGSGDLFLGIAPVVFSERLGQVSLAGSDEVLTRIGRQFSAPALLQGKQATRRAFGEQVGQYRIIQLFTHADADSTNREPTLFFADSSLRLSELTTTGQLPAELVGLSACNTGIGANQRGEGVFSLARGFASLGVPSVLTTLWNVENQATYALTELFYSKLAAGLPKDIALQQAKITYLTKADLSDQLPNQWAGLLLVGDADPIQTRNSPLVLWGVSLGLLGIAGAWWFRRQNRIRREFGG